MQNKEIIKLLTLYTKLLELNDENAFKIRALSNASFQLNKLDVSFENLSIQELEQLPNVGKSIAQYIHEINQTNTFNELQKYLEATPKGVVEMLSIKGIGGKKLRTIWKELNIETIEDLKKACKEHKIAPLKGFGEKLEEEILEFIEFKELSKGKYYYADIEQFAFEIEQRLQAIFGIENIALSGEAKRKMEIVEKLSFTLVSQDFKSTLLKLKEIDFLKVSLENSSPFTIRGIFEKIDLSFEIFLTSKERFVSELYINSASMLHLAQKPTSIQEKSILWVLQKENFLSENEIFSKFNLPILPPECREGAFEFNEKANETLMNLVDYQDLRGIFHNHTTYSDGENTLEEMALYCKELGYEYLGISDHSKTASYAKGLYENKIIEQHKEIDELNKKLAPFKIFKGIESDILGDGSLDYEENVLKSFDFIVASIHANLNMSQEKATERLIKAIENPYTTMLGHPTGRLLLRRKGYPIDHKKVIDACAANGVIIEINANPWRLDIDWRWIQYCLVKNVMLSINPDAHELEGYLDMKFGTYVARKGGLTKQFTFNTLTLEEVESYLKKRKNRFTN